MTGRRVENSTTPRVAILGAGAGGLCMAIALRRRGIDSFVIFEKTDGVGGTWRDNTYPGACCDAKSHLYSYSFELWPEWSQHFAAQPEILEYFEHCADVHGLRDHLRCNTEVTALTWEEETGEWIVDTRSGEHWRFDVVVSGLGQLNRPYVPDIEGLETFQGTTFHSARWDHTHDLTGRRVAVIGNAASGVQFIPQIAPKVARLHVYQRSANWILPRINPPYSERTKRLFREVPGVMRLYRAWLYASYESRFAMMRRDSRLGRLIERLAERYLESVIDDPELREALTPDFPAGCKRLLISSDYYPALTRDNVELVTTPIERIAPEGIVTADGVLRGVDTIIFGTGFDTTHFLAPLVVKGRNGRSLEEVWREGAEAYLGIAISGFPNLFMLYGPNTNLGHNSIIFMIECQVHYVMRLVDRMLEAGRSNLDVRAEVMARYNRELQRAMHQMVWESGCKSWYKNEFGKVTNNWPHTTVRYWARTRQPARGAFELRRVARPGDPAGRVQG
ncbi:flavin-containing monooxygenase [Rhabdothermincola sediminis]|uniref:flavin-containing monooxygenase n=1 Tax=Rhabdothermincola sediminis TaxID=2751370 RepID=UPI001AA026D7|nr:NAD(P)/FAD-dependent oxidoreductase [Rhabdothermincola sediminis]